MNMHLILLQCWPALNGEPDLMFPGSFSYCVLSERAYWNSPWFVNFGRVGRTKSLVSLNSFCSSLTFRNLIQESYMPSAFKDCELPVYLLFHFTVVYSVSPKECCFPFLCELIMETPGQHANHSLCPAVCKCWIATVCFCPGGRIHPSEFLLNLNWNVV